MAGRLPFGDVEGAGERGEDLGEPVRRLADRCGERETSGHWSVLFRPCGFRARRPGPHPRPRAAGTAPIPPRAPLPIAAPVVHQRDHQHAVLSREVARERRDLDRACRSWRAPRRGSCPRPGAGAACRCRWPGSSSGKRWLPGQLGIAREVQHLGERAHPVQLAEPAAVHQLHPRRRSDDLAHVLGEQRRGRPSDCRRRTGASAPRRC